VVRYISDSSYWLYIAHLPLVLLAQMVVRTWPISAWAKFSLVCVVVTGILLVTYEFMVRYTLIGTMLNGKKTRPRKASDESPSLDEPGS
jgi:peptidoglycan/LPS O-acetylase OafA/YrhL